MLNVNLHIFRNSLAEHLNLQTRQIFGIGMAVQLYVLKANFTDDFVKQIILKHVHATNALFVKNIAHLFEKGHYLREKNYVISVVAPLDF